MASSNSDTAKNYPEMPKRTFLNLAEEKRTQFIQQCMIEFSSHEYDTASISAVVRALGIAKGSVYQYFEHKKALWIYLRQQADQTRLTYLKEVYRSEFPDFYAYFAAIQQKQIAFTREHPAKARFLFRATLMETSEELTAEVYSWKQQQLQFFEKLVEAEKLMGSLDAGLRTKTVALFLQSISFTLREYLHELPIKNEDSAEPDLAAKKTVFSRITNVFSSGSDVPINPYDAASDLVDDLLQLVKKALKS